MRLLLPSLLGLLVFGCHTALADTTYYYAGTSFDFAEGPYTAQNRVTGYFTFSDPLPPNESVATGYGIIPASFSFTDGFQTINNADATYASFAPVSTNAEGDIVSYSIDVESTAGLIFATNTESISNAYSIGDVESGFGESDTPGTLTLGSPASVTPEPSSLLLFGTGVFGFAGVLTRRLVTTGNCARQ